MPASDYAYDPTGASAANLITNEATPFNGATDKSVFTQHGPFFGPSMSVRGRNGAGPWETLKPNEDYFFSPIFIEASAATGQEIFSYVVVKDAYTEIDLTYQALGQYNDDVLLAWITANTFDRSSLIEWMKVDGAAATYHPLVRDPDVIGKNVLEMINIGLEKIRVAINNPFSTTVMTAAELTQLQAAISDAASKLYVDDLHTRTSIAPSAATSGLPVDIHTMDTSGGLTTFRSIVTFKAATGEVDIAELLFAFDGANIAHSMFGRVNTNGPQFTLLPTIAGSDIKLQATSSVDGVFTVKVLSQY